MFLIRKIYLIKIRVLKLLYENKPLFIPNAVNKGLFLILDTL